MRQDGKNNINRTSSRTVRINISPTVKFREILKVLHNIHLPDYGGGFDPRKQPSDLGKAHDEIDPQSSFFIEYREKNNYLRFGMGLLLAKRTFTCFELDFFDNSEKHVDWESGKAVGSIIRLSTGVQKL